MGGNASKVKVAIPTNIWCFPYYAGENELLSTTKKASDSLTKVRNVLELISEGVGLGMSSASFNKATIFLTATTYLFQVLINRLSHNQNNQNNNNNNVCYAEFSRNSKGNKHHSSKKSGTLEEALVQLKIDKSLVHSAVSEFQAKIVAIKNRYTRLLHSENSDESPEIPYEDRRLEVVPALTLCEEILALFLDQTHLFYKNPLISSPCVVTFGGIYLAIAELALDLIPSYKKSLIDQMYLLKEALFQYKIACVRKRLSCLKLRQSIPDTMIDGFMVETGSGNGNSGSALENPAFYLEDNFLHKSPLKSEHEEYLSKQPGSFECFDGQREAFSAYGEALERKYDSFFEHVLQAVDSFSGFKNNNHCPSGQLNQNYGKDDTHFQKLHHKNVQKDQTD